MLPLLQAMTQGSSIMIVSMSFIWGKWRKLWSHCIFNILPPSQVPCEFWLTEHIISGKNLPKLCHLGAVEHIHHLLFTPASWSLLWRLIIREQPVVLGDHQGLFLVPALEENWWNFLQPSGKTLPGKGAVKNLGVRGQGMKICSKWNVAVLLWILTVTETLNFHKISPLPTMHDIHHNNI